MPPVCAGGRVDARGVAIIKIVDNRLVAQDAGARGVFPGRIHQSGIGRVNVVDRLVPPGLSRGSCRRILRIIGLVPHRNDCMPERIRWHVEENRMKKLPSC